MQNCCRFLSVHLEKNKKTFIKNEPFAIFLTVLLVEKKILYKEFRLKADHSTISTLIDKCKENHGKSERVYASRRGS